MVFLEELEMTPKERQSLSQRLTGYGRIWLKCDGRTITVEVERDGQWIEVIREYFDGPFSCCIEPLGIEQAFTDAGLMGVKTK